MKPAPSILVVDDGELDRVDALLRKLDVDFVRRTRPEGDAPLPRPRDLLLSSGPRALKMPPLAGSGAPLWACIYDQDFPPLRERLRVLGVHFLVSGRLDARTFELFLRQLLHRGAERRGLRRIPLQCPVELDVGCERRAGRLLELSRKSCVVRSERPLPAGETLAVRLPGELAGERPLELTGRVVRTSAADAGGTIGVLAFEEPDPDTTARLQGILSGRAPGTRVTPLAPEPLPGTAGERRGAPRRRYARRIEAIRGHGEAAPRLALGRDLSLGGLRVEASPPPREGAELTLALYGGAREEPVLVEARVVRVRGEEVALRFEHLTSEQRRGVERLLRGAPGLEALDGPAGGAAPLHVLEIL